MNNNTRLLYRVHEEKLAPITIRWRGNQSMFVVEYDAVKEHMLGSIENYNITKEDGVDIITTPYIDFIRTRKNEIINVFIKETISEDEYKNILFEEFAITVDQLYSMENELIESFNIRLEAGSYTYNKYLSVTTEFVEDMINEARSISSRIKMQRLLESRCDKDLITSISREIIEWNNKLEYLISLQEKVLQENRVVANTDGIKNLISLTDKFIESGSLNNS